MRTEVGAASGLPDQVENQRKAIKKPASEHLVREIACSGAISGIVFFVVKSEPRYKLRNHVRLTGVRSELLDEPVLIFERDQMEGKWGERLSKRARPV